MIQIMVCYIVTIFGLYTICIYVLTDDASEEGDMMSQIQDFTAFMIIYDIDALIMGPLFNNFIKPQDWELDDQHKEELEKKKEDADENEKHEFDFERKVKIDAINSIQEKLGSSCSIIKVMYILRTFIFYPIGVYLECNSNFVWYAIIFITRADPTPNEIQVLDQA